MYIARIWGTPTGLLNPICLSDKILDIPGSVPIETAKLELRTIRTIMQDRITAVFLKKPGSESGLVEVDNILWKAEAFSVYKFEFVFIDDAGNSETIYLD
jgi:hypothetical protein